VSNQGLTEQSLASRPGCPQTCDPPASASQVLSTLFWFLVFLGYWSLNSGPHAIARQLAVALTA
jgi:hypothetical protein